MFLDGLHKNKARAVDFDLSLAQFVLRKKRSSVLFCYQGRKEKFITGQSRLYFTREELEKMGKSGKVFETEKSIDGIIFGKKTPEFIYTKKKEPDVYLEIKYRYEDARNYLQDLFAGTVQGVGVGRMWNISIVSSLIFGMFLMTMMYRYLGQGASAKEKDKKEAVQEMVLGEEDVKGELEASYITQILKNYEEEKKEGLKNEVFEKELRKMVKGYPIEEMVPFIAKKDRVVAAFLVAIAKKESDWGKHVPVLDGEDCYNYWGFRAQRKRMGTGGHTCFDSPEDAVDSVARRLESLVSNEKISTPSKMVVVWKCGYDCSWDTKEAVQKWVSDVERYFNKFDKFSK